jgi:hypothetical protein
MDWDTRTQTGARTSGVEDPTPIRAMVLPDRRGRVTSYMDGIQPLRSFLKRKKGKNDQIRVAES